MPNKYTKSKRADRDIIEITVRSLIDFGEQQTIKYMDSLTERIQWLADNTEQGSSYTHRKTGREYQYYNQGSHVIYYRQRKNDIFIVRILHKRMLPEKHI